MPDFLVEPQCPSAASVCQPDPEVVATAATPSSRDPPLLIDIFPHVRSEVAAAVGGDAELDRLLAWLYSSEFDPHLRKAIIRDINLPGHTRPEFIKLARRHAASLNPGRKA